ncbi:unnamed protein product [Ectocarpus sp. CCAP 1310/34]|nr:unnamed protein product [Ectocarpus sp. CCAP 1310/34]
MGDISRRVQVYRLSTPEKVAAVSAVGPAAAVPPASEPAELVTMRVVILLGGVAVGIGMFAIFWAWCYAEHRLWLLGSAAAPPEGNGIDQPLLAAHEEEQECCSCPMDELEAQQQRSDVAARAASLGVPTDSTSSVPSVDSTSSLALAAAAAAAAASSNIEGENEEFTAAEQPIRPLLRDFTIAELNTFDGGESPLSRKPHPIFISLGGTVYDASNGRGIYGPSGELAAFAGHDVSRWVARGLVASKDDGKSDLDDLSLTGLNRIERMTLAGWEERFKACGYPVVGRVVLQ